MLSSFLLSLLLISDSQLDTIFDQNYSKAHKAVKCVNLIASKKSFIGCYNPLCRV